MQAQLHRKRPRIGEAAQCIHALFRGGDEQDEQIGALIVADYLSIAFRTKK